MTYFLIAIVAVTICYLIFAPDEKKEALKKINAQRELDEKALKEENQRIETLKTKISSIVDNKSTKSIEIDVMNLPTDFIDLEYTAFDFETASKDPLSAISLGIAHFKGSHLLEALEFRFPPINSSIINENEYEFSYLHGITPDQVENLPSFHENWKNIKSHLDGKHLVAHNSDFDVNILKHLLKEVNDKLTNNKISCTYQLSKKFMKYENSYKLESLCYNYKIPYWNHKASYDAISAGILFMHTIAQSPGGAVTENAMIGKKISLKS